MQPGGYPRQQGTEGYDGGDRPRRGRPRREGADCGPRVAVVDVVERLWAGEDVEDLAADYGLSVDDIEAAREYAIEHFAEIEAAHRERTDAYDDALEESRAPRPAE